MLNRAQLALPFTNLWSMKTALQTLGGCSIHAYHCVRDFFVCLQMEIPLLESSIFDCVLSIATGRFEAVSPRVSLFFLHEALTRENRRSHLLLPSQSLASILHAGSQFLQAGLSIVFSGQRCSGKTTIANILFKNQGKRWSVSPSDTENTAVC